ncbi:hypothetical protein HK103_000294 [Boothiomyces macroporosus]|uniref:Ral GTPase-activating protein subunit alpha/beta N-terminal domain-containing protein n=1 Tax=Boothiomyces macroporosus TaxID=261099 RepID=A0AAD5Y7L9_9FUNG|nr:hypothetical protein HK103_000272 [Boothiomyces macroporosus]KAJ3260684.1 hypothetical protein HK103_000294 [Boothiomyces macroporosus]
MLLKERVFTINSKDAQNLFEVLDLIQKAMKYLHEKLNTGWNQSSLCAVIESLLYDQNHEKLKRYGLKLLIQYLEMKTEIDENSALLMNLLLSCDEIEIKQLENAYNDCIGEDERGLITKHRNDWKFVQFKHVKQEKRVFKLPTVENMSPADENLFVIVPKEANEKFTNAEMVSEFLLSLIEMAKSIAVKITVQAKVLHSEKALPLRNIWDLFKLRILAKFFPAVSKRLGLQVPEEAFEYCPENILNSLLQFILKISSVTVQLSELSPQNDVALALLQQLLLENEENREILHEMFRQSFIIGKFQVTNYIFASWLTVPVEEVHQFLRERIMKSTEELESPAVVHSVDSRTNIMIRRYVRYFRLGILHMDVEKEEFVSNLKELLNFYRFLGYERFHLLESTTWNVLMNLLIDIQIQVFRNSNPSYEVAVMLAETMFCTWIRSRNVSEPAWTKLESYISRAKESKGVLKVWADIMTNLTTIVCDKVYGISNLSSLMKEDPSKRKRVGKTKGEHATLTPALRNNANLEENASKSSDDGGLDLSHMMSIHGDAALFVQLSEIKWWDASTSLFLWKNVLTSIGKLHEIKVGSPNLGRSGAFRCD